MSDTRIDDRLEDSADDAAFRLEVRRWLEANAPGEPGAVEDLNRLRREARWDRGEKRFVTQGS